ncbi:MAG TPA: hypothetical protein VFM17_10560 [Candidatus Eisenbacteria bacterium]|nr:hypothetical protein [Candidatus Eisenbacteria bacterium]
MSLPTADIALLTDRRWDVPVAPEGDWYVANILLDDRLLTEALASRGLTAVRVDWARPEIDWSRFRCAVLRTTWDYFTRFPEFTEWMARLERVTRLCNRPEIVRWNVDKHYLADLESRGVAVVPTRFFERGSGVELREALERSGWTNAIVKPCVSGGAWHTYRVSPDGAAALESTWRELLANQAMMIQPFQEDIVGRGEVTLMVLNGRYTHAVRKTAKSGDFRVQDDHGGSVHDYEPTREEIDLALRAMAACRPAPVYGRADMVRDNDGRLAIMELELIEPELWLRHHPPAAGDLAEGIARFVEAG